MSGSGVPLFVGARGGAEWRLVDVELRRSARVGLGVFSTDREQASGQLLVNALSLDAPSLRLCVLQSARGQVESL